MDINLALAIPYLVALALYAGWGALRSLRSAQEVLRHSTAIQATIEEAREEGRVPPRGGSLYRTSPTG